MAGLSRDALPVKNGKTRWLFGRAIRPGNEPPVSSKVVVTKGFYWRGHCRPARGKRPTAGCRGRATRPGLSDEMTSAEHQDPPRCAELRQRLNVYLIQQRGT